MKTKLLYFLLIAVTAAAGMFSLQKLVPENGQSPHPSGYQTALMKLHYALSISGTLPTGLIILVLAGAIFLVIYRRLRFSSGNSAQKPGAGTTANTAFGSAIPAQVFPDMIGLPDVEAFFLNIYRRQIGAPLEAPGLKTSEPAKDKSSGRVYTLSVKHKGRWQSRHMSIGPIGDGGRSKSQCFYVIFDTHMVVKIPPVPIRDFSDYIGRIRRESTLVEKLSPRICIIPNLSVIMSRVQPPAGLKAFAGMTQEEKYIHVLEVEPNNQGYLKIGGAFAFFMNLSRHFFLSHVLSELHDVDKEVHKTMASDVSVMRHGYDFEMKYGATGASICSAMIGIYNNFIFNGVSSLAKTNEQHRLNDSRQRELFLAYLTGEPKAGADWPDLSESGKSEVARLLRISDPASKETINAYKQLVQDYAGEIVFHQNRAQLEALVTNLLELLLWLAEKGIAVRDLKPDNLLVAGNSENYPLFLLSAGGYSIGLIDLETAVDYDPANNRPFLQPHLGGTPAYATPSHFFMNTVLKEVYEDLPRILHLQDWFAMVGIIFEVVAGHRLFLQTGSLVPAIIQAIRQARSNRQDMKQLFSALNGAFWETARNEFARKTRESESRLNKLAVSVPAPFRKAFVTCFSSDPGHIAQTLSSRRIKTGTDLANWLQDPLCTLTVKELLEMMFGVVYAVMAGEELYPCPPGAGKTAADDDPRIEALATRSLGYTFTGEIDP